MCTVDKESGVEITYSEMRISDYEEILALWQRCEGIGLSKADERGPMELFLNQNQGLCHVASMDGRIVGTVLCGCDGRRGYLYHLAVEAAARRRGIGRALVDLSLAELSRRGIQKCHLMVFASNLEGQAFWSRIGWIHRPEILPMSIDTVAASSSGSCPC